MRNIDSKILELENEYMTLKTKITMGPPADAMEDLNTIYKHFLEMEKYEKKINEKIIRFFGAFRVPFRAHLGRILESILKIN